MKNFYKLASLAAVAMMSFAGAQTADAQASLNMVYPGPGVAFNYNTYTEIQLIFSGDPKVNGEVTVTYTSKETGEPVSKIMEGRYISYPEPKRFDININKAMEANPGESTSSVIPPYYETNILPYADETKGMTINLKNVTVDGTPVSVNNEGDGVEIDNGNITLYYSVEQAPQIMNEVWPETFYNYWPAGDPDGIATITFDQNIESVYSVNVTWGHVNLGSEGGNGDDPNPYVALTPKVNGKTVTIDFTNIDFTAKTSSFTKPLSGFKEVSVLVQGIKGVNGLTYADAEGNQTIVAYIDFTNEAVEGDDEPGEEPGDNPGEDPGDNPGEDPGDNPGEDPGDNPGEDPGDNPGEDPGDNPGEDPGDEPGNEDPDGPTTGVNALANENGKFTVYNLQGVKVLDNVSSINNLNAGMYIVNGKKVVIRK